MQNQNNVPIYHFEGKITCLGRSFKFVVEDGLAYFDMLSAPNTILLECGFELIGRTNDDKEIHILVEKFYPEQFPHSTMIDGQVVSYTNYEATVGACVILEDGEVSDIDNVCFYSYEISKITNMRVSGALNDEICGDFSIKNKLATYEQSGHAYELSIGFLEKRPYYNGQCLKLKSDSDFDLEMLKDSFWTVYKLFAFLYQRRTFPLQAPYLKSGDKIIGRLYVDHIEREEFIGLLVKCIPIYNWGDKLENLLRLIVDKKIYYRHLPAFKQEERSLTSGRFMMALAGLESVLNSLDIKVEHSVKHTKANENVKKALIELKEKSNRKTRELCDRIILDLDRNEEFQNKIKAAILDNEAQIGNFFQLNILGDNADNIAEDLAKTRNNFAHGNLDFDLGEKNSYQMRFVVLFVLYLQLLLIGFTKDEAALMVPHMLHGH